MKRYTTKHQGSTILIRVNFFINVRLKLPAPSGDAAGFKNPAAGSSAINTGNGREPWKNPADVSVLRQTTIIINSVGKRLRHYHSCFFTGMTNLYFF
jgi:hypothetical protein